MFGDNESFGKFFPGADTELGLYLNLLNGNRVGFCYRWDSDADIKALVDMLSKQKQIVFDTETTNIDVYSAELVGLSFAIKAHEAWYLSMSADREACQKKLELLRPTPC